MNQLSGFAVMNFNGGNRISYTYDEIDDKTGDFLKEGMKGNFNVMDESLLSHIEAIRDYIRKNRLKR